MPIYKSYNTSKQYKGRVIFSAIASSYQVMLRLKAKVCEKPIENWGVLPDLCVLTHGEELFLQSVYVCGLRNHPNFDNVIEFFLSQGKMDLSCIEFMSIIIIVSHFHFHPTFSYTGNMQDGRKCKAKLNESCYISFNVSMRENTIYLKDTPECTYDEAPPAPILEIVLGILFGIVLIGLLLLLLWKLLVTYHDRQEYNNFQKSVLNQGKGDENPLYNAPATKFNNPTYVGATQ